MRVEFADAIHHLCACGNARLNAGAEKDAAAAQIYPLLLPTESFLSDPSDDLIADNF